MAINRKLGKTTDIRLAMLKTQVTDLLLHGQIETTVARAKEVQPMAEKLIALAIREKDNFEEVDSKVVKAKLDSNGNKVTELVKSKNGNEYLKVVKEETTEKRQKDMPSTHFRSLAGSRPCRSPQCRRRTAPAPGCAHRPRYRPYSWRPR